MEFSGNEPQHNHLNRVVEQIALMTELPPVADRVCCRLLYNKELFRLMPKSVREAIDEVATVPYIETGIPPSYSLRIESPKARHSPWYVSLDPDYVDVFTKPISEAGGIQFSVSEFGDVRVRPNSISEPEQISPMRLSEFIALTFPEMPKNLLMENGYYRVPNLEAIKDYLLDANGLHFQNYRADGMQTRGRGENTAILETSLDLTLTKRRLFGISRFHAVVTDTIYEQAAHVTISQNSVAGKGDTEILSEYKLFSKSIDGSEVLLHTDDTIPSGALDAVETALIEIQMGLSSDVANAKE